VKPMTIIVQSCARVLVPFAVIFGMYIIAHGHLTPGGGFQGGAAIASVIALVIISYGHDFTAKAIAKEQLVKLESAGLIAFISLVFLGLGATAFYNFLAHGGVIFGQAVPYGVNGGFFNTAGILPLCNAVVGLEVVAGIGIILLMMAYGAGAKE